MTYDEHASGPIQGPVPSGPVGGGVFSPDQIKQILDGGTAKIIGHHPVIPTGYTQVPADPQT